MWIFPDWGSKFKTSTDFKKESLINFKMVVGNDDNNTTTTTNNDNNTFGHCVRVLW